MRFAGVRVLLPLVLIVILAPIVWAWASQPPPLSRTGIPRLGSASAEATCQTGCHLGNAVNNSQGKLEILGLPAAYTPGRTYDLSVRLTSTSTQAFAGRRWGFELTCAHLADGKPAGTFTAPGLTIRQASAFYGSRFYVSHDPGALHIGAASPSVWSLQWTAPASDEGAIGFFAAGNAANGDGNHTGDFIYTTADTTVYSGVPVERTTWGRLKRGIFGE